MLEGVQNNPHVGCLVRRTTLDYYDRPLSMGPHRTIVASKSEGPATGGRDDGRAVAGSDSISKYVHPETMALPICLPGTIISLVRGCGCAPLRLTHTHLHCRYARLSGPRGMTTATAVSAQNPISPPSANATKRDG